MSERERSAGMPIHLVVILLLLLPLSPAFADSSTQLSEARIRDVTVFPDQALVTRSVRVSLHAGRQSLLFPPLPASVSSDSVRVSGEGAEGVRLLEVNVKRLFLDAPYGEKRADLDRQKEILAEKLREIDGKLSALGSQRLFYESIRVGYGERISKELQSAKPPVSELGQVARFVGESLLSLDSDSRAAEKEKREISAKLGALQREIDQLKGRSSLEALSVAVVLEADRPSDTALVLSYLVPNASWEPLYDLRLGENGKEMELVYRAQVRQNSGEAWNDVAMTLSTARPSIGGAPPELVPWHLRLIRPEELYPRHAKAMPQAAARMSFDSAEMAALPAPAPLEQMQAAAEEGIASTDFKIIRPVSILSDGSSQGVTIATASLPVVTSRRAVPKRSPFAFLQSKVENSLGYPLLPGRANLFVGNRLNGSTWLKGIAAGESEELFFGVDEGIKVKRTEIKLHRDAGFLSGNRQSYRYILEATNHRSERLVLTLLDQMPLPDDDAIKVTLAESSIAPEIKQETGEMRWELSLDPREKKEIRFELQVEYPKDRQIRGL